jgi:phosphoribosyl-ATP pyrophosphohydrolase
MVAKPLVVLGQDGAVLDAAIMSQKAFNKSTEHGRLWVLHADTGRVLPYHGDLAFVELVDVGELYRATVHYGEWLNSTPAVLSDIEGRPAPEDDLGERTGEISETGEWESVLRGLVGVILDRKEKRPEGSYTSYLFNSGEAKIRKKTGEEAIELVLAASPEETASEAADLVYHLLVLLAELDIPFDDVIHELESRG